MLLDWGLCFYGWFACWVFEGGCLCLVVCLLLSLGVWFVWLLCGCWCYLVVVSYVWVYIGNSVADLLCLNMCGLMIFVLAYFVWFVWCLVVFGFVELIFVELLIFVWFMSWWCCYGIIDSLFWFVLLFIMFVGLFIVALRLVDCVVVFDLTFDLPMLVVIMLDICGCIWWFGVTCFMCLNVLAWLGCCLLYRFVADYVVLGVFRCVCCLWSVGSGWGLIYWLGVLLLLCFYLVGVMLDFDCLCFANSVAFML